MSSFTHDRIRQRLDELGISEEKASRAAGLDKSYLRKLFDRPDSSPRSDTLGKLAVVLQKPVEWFHAGAPDMPAESPGAEVRLAPVALPDRLTMPADVPVYGTAAASHLKGAFQLEPGVIDYVRRPPALSAARDAYALYVEGTSMEPRYQQGDLVFVHPHRPARNGDTVIVQVEVAPHVIEASIGYLRRRTGLNIVIGKLNPEAEVQIETKRIRHVHRVLTLNELFGV